MTTDYAIRFRQNDQGVWGFVAIDNAQRIESLHIFPSKAAARDWAIKSLEDGGRELREIEAVLA